VGRGESWVPGDGPSAALQGRTRGDRGSRPRRRRLGCLHSLVMHSDASARSCGAECDADRQSRKPPDRAAQDGVCRPAWFRIERHRAVSDTPAGFMRHARSSARPDTSAATRKRSATADATAEACLRNLSNASVSGTAEADASLRGPRSRRVRRRAVSKPRWTEHLLRSPLPDKAASRQRSNFAASGGAELTGVNCISRFPMSPAGLDHHNPRPVGGSVEH